METDMSKRNRPFDMEEARELGNARGWIHAAFVDACGTESDHGRTLDEIREAMRPGSITYPPCVDAFNDGFDAGMEEFDNEVDAEMDRQFDEEINAVSAGDIKEEEDRRAAE
jgi:hypothetical protein